MQSMYADEQTFQHDNHHQPHQLGNGNMENNLELNGYTTGNHSSLDGTNASGIPGQIDTAYEKYGNMNCIPISLQQHQHKSGNVRYVAIPQMQQMGLNHVVPGEYMQFAGYSNSGTPRGNHVVNMYDNIGPQQPFNSQSNMNAHQSYDRYPAMCSLLAIFCCPITSWCSLPALAYSLCAYTDYKASDMHQYRHKSDIARRLVILSCTIGLILCICLAIFTFFFTDFLHVIISEGIHSIRKRNRLDDV